MGNVYPRMTIVFLCIPSSGKLPYEYQEKYIRAYKDRDLILSPLLLTLLFWEDEVEVWSREARNDILL